MNRFLTSAAIASTFVVLGLSNTTMAAPVINGSIDPGDLYGPSVQTISDNYVNGFDLTGGTNQVSTFFTYDASFVYGAIHLDSGVAGYLGANVYVYSSSLNTSNVTNSPGVYGDGDDIILEGANGYRTALNGPPWAGPALPYTAATADYAFNGTDTVEFSIARSLLGDYDSFRFGGQLFSFEFHTGGDRVDGAIVAVPEPTSIGLVGVAAAGLLARRRRRTV